jgi:hypothetical protein
MQPSPGTGWRSIPLMVRVPILSRPHYKPILSRLERAAYAAAHKILSVETHHPELACAGERRSRQVDDIARIIMEAMGK